MSLSRALRPRLAVGRSASSEAPIRIGISTCLLGEHVRFDGGHKRDAYLVETLGRHVEWVPVCPEAEAGLGVPRESMNLRRVGAEVRLVTTKSGVDHTDAVRAYAARRIATLRSYELCGYVLKKNSPSCGMEQVRIYGARGAVTNGRGLFAEALLKAFPYLPIEEEGSLGDSGLRENFIERVFAYRRLRSLFASRWTVGRLVAFHHAHELQLAAHSPRLYGELGRLVADAKAATRPALRQSYEATFTNALATMATPKRHMNVLHRALRYFSQQLDSGSRSEISDLIDDHGRGLLPLVVPLALVRHYARQYRVTYLQLQTYLDPHPKELMLRNHG